ncbi:hypothetical protein DUNSADRAFT_7861 [Dunaliella salina]|uniref:Encoded protein n=1 Tax=Dunaliella salina TaxID=3046 RepID=A0ABQ7FT33_DUNSA|nr:hypothetical protein DUNSADRAFT_7861 [Dunaliella salina]|eukprot:KAF5825644.1 hypothetical protein DUNSADRAFT_7861 [Dunaliella salina]
MLASFQQSHKQPRSWGSHSSPPINSVSRVGTRAQSRAVSKAPSRAVSRPTSAFPRHGAPLHPKPAIKQPHFSSQTMGSNKG